MQQVAPFKYGRRRPKGKKGCLPMLTKRQNHIIDILNSERRPVTGKELGKLLGVSDRTIRTDVEGINSE